MDEIEDKKPSSSGSWPLVRTVFLRMCFLWLYSFIMLLS